MKLAGLRPANLLSKALGEIMGQDSRNATTYSWNLIVILGLCKQFKPLPEETVKGVLNIYR